MSEYAPRDKNVIQKIFQDHFSDFEKQYNDHHAKQYGKYRIIRIKESVEKFLECGDYTKVVACIKCTNRDCTYEYFHLFVNSLKEACKSWHLCPSCNQKGLLLFAEHLSENVILKLPHRQFVFTAHKLLRIYFKNNRNLFADVSIIQFSIISDYYNEAEGTAIKSEAVLSY